MSGGKDGEWGSSTASGAGRVGDGDLVSPADVKEAVRYAERVRRCHVGTTAEEELCARALLHLHAIQSAPPPEELREIEKRAANVAGWHGEHAGFGGVAWEFHARAETLLASDVPRLLAAYRAQAEKADAWIRAAMDIACDDPANLAERLGKLVNARAEAWREVAAMQAERDTMRAAVAWFMGRDTGISSQAICLHMLGLPPGKQWGPRPPMDQGDVGRCVRLLQQPFAAGWDARLDEMIPYELAWKFAVTDIRRALLAAEGES